MDDFTGFCKLGFCHIETKDDFLFCVHGVDTPIRLVFSENKDMEAEKSVDVFFCPICGYNNEKSKMQNEGM